MMACQMLLTVAAFYFYIIIHEAWSRAGPITTSIKPHLRKKKSFPFGSHASKAKTLIKEVTKTFICKPFGPNATFSRKGKFFACHAPACTVSPPRALAQRRLSERRSRMFPHHLRALVSELLTSLQTQGKHVKVGVIVSLA